IARADRHVAQPHAPLLVIVEIKATARVIQHRVVIEVVNEEVMKGAAGADRVELHQRAAVIGGGEPREERRHDLLRTRRANERRRHAAAVELPQPKRPATRILMTAALKRKESA